MNTPLTLAPVFVFFVTLLAVGFFARRRAKRVSGNFSSEYFIGSRSLGGFVFAMTFVATYSSVSSFVGGPGLAWQRGFGWVYYATIQVVSVMMVMGIVGKKIAIIGRKIGAVTVVDIVRARYSSDALANISAVVLVVFFTAMMAAQYSGGANLFAAAADVDYEAGLVIFALVVVVYTAVGGYRGVALTDTICAMVMLFGMGIIGFAIMRSGGGLKAIMEKIGEDPARLQIRSGGALSVPFLLSQWLLCGVCTLGLPQSLVRTLSYRDSRSLHRAMIYGTVVIGLMMAGMHLLGTLSHGVISEIPSGKTTDAIMPALIVQKLPPLLAGFAIIGTLAATMSTVSSLLIMAASAIIKDLWLRYRPKHGTPPDDKKLRRFSVLVTLIIGLISMLIAVKPPSVIVWINLFAFGGLQSAFFWTFLLGLFWKRANAAGATLAMVGGVVSYCLAMALRIPLGGSHHIVIGIGVAFVLFIAGSLLGKPEDEKTLRLFFPEAFPLPRRQPASGF
ncbi:MAG: sodium/pantothenate symporter [Spirochaetaceae bacterium]|jgi:sodium/pantothenate symporter|nr:sodium/pantothenate symporter [Spirochaetaceae bacterium]